MKRAAWLFAFAVCLLGAAFPEDGAPAGGSPGRVRVMTSFSFSGFAPADAERWASSLEAAVAKLERTETVLRAPLDRDPLAAAGLAAYDALLSVSASVEASGTISFIAVLTDAVSGAELYRGGASLPLPTESALARTFWLPAADAVDRLVVARARAERADAPAAEAGAARPPRAERSWYLESGLYMGQFADFWIARRMDSRWTLKAGLHQFLFGYYLSDDEDAGLVSFTLIEPGVGVELTLFGAPDLPRLHLSATAFVRLSGSSFLIDPIAPFAAAAMLGAERRIGPKLSLFCELGTVVYPFCDGELMASTVPRGDRRPTNANGGDRWFIDTPRFRLGGRLAL